MSSSAFGIGKREGGLFAKAPSTSTPVRSRRCRSRRPQGQGGTWHEEDATHAGRASWKESPQAQEPWAFGLSMVSPAARTCREVDVAPSR